MHLFAFLIGILPLKTAIYKKNQIYQETNNTDKTNDNNETDKTNETDKKLSWKSCRQKMGWQYQKTQHVTSKAGRPAAHS